MAVKWPKLRGIRAAVYALLTALALAAGAYSTAATDRYDYDALGRLLRHVDAQGRAVEYVYDAAGNLLQVAGGGVVQPPAISTISPASVRRDRVSQVQLTGTGLIGVSVSNDDPGIAVSNVIATSQGVSFKISVYSTARPGTQIFRVQNAVGVAQATLEVIPEITYTVLPVPLAVPPDGIARQFTIEASGPDTEPVIFTPTTLNTAIARAGPASITLPAGATQATGTVTGITAGATVLRLSIAGRLDTNDTLLYVTADFARATVVHAKLLGIVKGDANASPSGVSGPFLAPALGIVKGDLSAPAGNVPYGPTLAAPVGLVKGDPSSPVNITFNPVSAAPLGIIKGNATDTAGNAVIGPVLAAPMGIVKGDPASPAVDSPFGPVLAPALGVQKP